MTDTTPKQPARFLQILFFLAIGWALGLAQAAMTGLCFR